MMKRKALRTLDANKPGRPAKIKRVDEGDTIKPRTAKSGTKSSTKASKATPKTIKPSVKPSKSNAKLRATALESPTPVTPITPAARTRDDDDVILSTYSKKTPTRTGRKRPPHLLPLHTLPKAHTDAATHALQ
jgi:hypothetical protein